jgi:hypothetical protein
MTSGTLIQTIGDAGNEYPHTYEDKTTTDRFY